LLLTSRPPLSYHGHYGRAFGQNQEAQLNELAARTGRATDDLVREAVDQFLSHDEWFKEQVQIGVDQLARGEFLEEEEMDARVDRMLRS
jgi:predicted transcriptional regulator